MELTLEYSQKLVQIPALSCTQEGAKAMREYNPDVIIALGGGSAMDAGKIMWVLYEHPNIRFKRSCNEIYGY